MDVKTVKETIKEKILLNLLQSPISSSSAEVQGNINAGDFVLKTENDKIVFSKFSKTTGQLLIALEKDKDRYNAIVNDLKKMAEDGWLRSKKEPVSGAPGEHPTWYDIIYEESVLKKILKYYDDYLKLLNIMQKNKIIQSILIRKHYWLIDYLEWHKKYLETVLTVDAPHSADSLCYLRIYPKIFPIVNGACPDCDVQQQKICQEKIDEFKIYIEITQESLIERFKKYLILSPDFFKICLNNSPSELKQKFDKIYSLTYEGQKNFPKINFDSPFENAYDEDIIDFHIIQPHLAYFDKLFEICVLVDTSINQTNDEAKAYVSRINKKQVVDSEILMAILDSFIKSNMEKHNQVK